MFYIEANLYFPRMVCIQIKAHPPMFDEFVSSIEKKDSGAADAEIGAYSRQLTRALLLGSFPVNTTTTSTAL